MNEHFDESVNVIRTTKPATITIVPTRPRISIIISARNEFPNIVHTVQSIVNALEFDGYGYDPETGTVDFEILIADNGSEDKTSLFWEWAKSNETETMLTKSPRGIAYNKVVKVMFDPVLGNVSSRNYAAQYARGEYLFFCDAHMAIPNGVFKKMLTACDESGGIVHPVVEWMGAYPPKGGFQYSVKVGEKFWGTWNRLAVSTKEWFYIPGSGHCFFCVKRDQFMNFGGYNNYFRVYGGGELYLDFKWWMFGSSSVSVPDAIVYHLSAGRGYTYYSDDLVHNLMLSAFVIAGRKFAERVLLTFLNKPGENYRKYYDLFEQAMVEGEKDRNFIEEKASQTFEQIMFGGGGCDGHCNPRAGKHKMTAWDLANEARFGKHLSGVLVFDKWLGDLRTEEAKRFVSERPYLKEGE